MRKTTITKSFERDLDKLRRSGRDKREKLDQALALLENDLPLPEPMHDHPLSGKWKRLKARDCHISPDLVLVYAKPPGELILFRLTSHSELF